LKEQLGDRHPLEYGGYFVYEDKTGVYAPEAELLITPENDGGKYEVRRFILEPCTFQDGVLSDNKFHPETPAWFAGSIGSIANFIGMPVAELIDALVNGNLVHKAMAWQAIGDYHGFDNLDSYPLYFNRAEAEARINQDKNALPVA
jgi:hypothetical protein